MMPSRARLVNSQKIYPNTTVANSAIINLSRMSHRLVNETLGIEYKHCAKEIDAFCNKLRSLINSYKETYQNWKISVYACRRP